MDMELSHLAILLGLIVALPQTFCLAQTQTAIRWAKAFPRANTPGYVLMAVGTVWFLNNLRQEPQTLQALSNRYWSDILLENYTVDSTHEMAGAIAALTKADIVDYYNKRVIRNGGSRLVTIAVGSTHGAEYESNHAPGSKTISISDDIDWYNAFKADAEVYQYSH